MIGFRVVLTLNIFVLTLNIEAIMGLCMSWYLQSCFTITIICQEQIASSTLYDVEIHD